MRFALLLLFVLCFSQGPMSASSDMPRAWLASFTPGRTVDSELAGEWLGTCQVDIYEDGERQKNSHRSEPSLIVVDSDPDASYQLYKFPVGFGEALPRLRKVGENQYVGDDTVRGISTLVKQLVEVQGKRIIIKQTVIDTARNQTQTETTCTGVRSKSTLTFPQISTGACSSDPPSVALPENLPARGYESVRPFSDGLAAVAIAAPGTRYWKWGFIDKTGKIVVPTRYDVATSFHDGLAAVARSYGRGRNLKWGVVEKLGPQVTPSLNYDAVKILGEGFAAVGYAVPGRPGLRWNLINRENTTIFHGFDDIGCFVGGRARASYTDGKIVRTGYVNNVGDFVFDKK